MNDNMKVTIGGFRKFVKNASRIVDKISVTTGGAIGFSTSFSNDHKLEGYTSAILYWNDSSREIGIEFTTDDGEGTLKLLKNKNGYGYTINAKAFFAVNHIDARKYHARFPYRLIPFSQLDPSYTGSENMYVFAIQEPQPELVTPQITPAAPSIPAPLSPVEPENNQAPTYPGLG